MMSAALVTAIDHIMPEIMPQYCPDIFHKYMETIVMHQNEFQISHKTTLFM
jgi:hypothetical protein